MSSSLRHDIAPPGPEVRFEIGWRLSGYEVDESGREGAWSATKSPTSRDHITSEAAHR
jgi:hypothetical protein